MAHLTKVFKDINYETMDWAVYNYFDKKFPLVIDGRKVPVIFATPERWAQVQRDSYLKDEKGQLMLPAIAVRRSGTEINRSRYVPKQPETDIKVKVPELTPEGQQKFAANGNPLYIIHRIPYPRFVNLTYSVIIWASYFVDINEIQQRYLWEGIDHVFTQDGYWFTGTIQGITENNNNEDNTKQERIQKVEYTIMLEGYISDTRSVRKERSVNTLNFGFDLERFPDEKDPLKTFTFSKPGIAPPTRR